MAVREALVGLAGERRTTAVQEMLVAGLALALPLLLLSPV
jgi:hypothetical protein